MKISTTFKISLFAFLSAVICGIGNNVINLDVLSYVTQGLGFLAYLFFIIWLCQLIYGKIKLSVNLIFLFMSFALAAYTGIMLNYSTDTILSTYYLIFFYLFVIVCIGSAVLLVGRLIFSSPKEQPAKELPAEIPVQKADAWKCVCGAENTGKFCSECGAAMPVVVVEETVEENN